jgi:hypothetical protein
MNFAQFLLLSHEMLSFWCGDTSCTQLHKNNNFKLNFLGDPNAKPNSMWYVLICELSNFYFSFVLNMNCFKYSLYKYGSQVTSPWKLFCPIYNIMEFTQIDVDGTLRSLPSQDYFWRAPKFLVDPLEGPSMRQCESNWNLEPLPDSQHLEG